MDHSKEPDQPGRADLPVSLLPPDGSRDLQRPQGDAAPHAPHRSDFHAPDHDYMAPRDPLQRERALRAFSALSNGDRLDLIRLLVPAGTEGLAAGEIARRLGVSASRLSFHLAQLEQAGLLSARKVARNVFYAVDPAGLGAAFSHLLSDCCADHPEVIACWQTRQPASER